MQEHLHVEKIWGTYHYIYQLRLCVSEDIQTYSNLRYSVPITFLKKKLSEHLELIYMDLLCD